MMIENFSFLLAEYFITSLENLIEIYNPSIYPVSHFPDKKQIIGNHFLVWCKNPVKIWVLIIYILKKLHKLYPDLKVEETTRKYSMFVNLIIDNWENIWEAESLFTDRWLNGWEVIDLLCYENIEELLSNQTISLIVADFWSGPYYKRTFLTPSAWYQTIASKIIKPNKFYEYIPNKIEEMSENIRKWRISKEIIFSTGLLPHESHFFKFEVWKRSIGVIYIVDGMLIVIIAIYVQYLFLNLIDISFEFQSIYSQFVNISTQLQSASTSNQASLYTQFLSIEASLISKADESLSVYSSFMYQVLFLTMYFAKNLCQILFAKLRRKKIQIITPEIVINFVSWFVVLYQFWNFNFHFLKMSAPIPKYWSIYIVSEVFQDKFIKGPLGSGLIIWLQWCRVFFILQASKIFGPLIEILLNLLKELFKFIAIYGLIFAVFLSAGMVFFFNYSEFKSENWRGLLYLFSASLGSFDFSLFTQDETYLSKQYGWIYLILFLVLTNIVLINFLIAILSNKYTEMETKKKILYNRKILEIKQIQAEDKYYSCLIASFVPLNIFILPFFPFVIFCKSEKFNEILLYACYLPMALIGIIVFTAASIILLPFAYIISIYSSISSFILNLKIQRITFKVIMIELGWMLLVIWMALPYLMIQTVIDTIMFIVSLFDESTKTKQECSNIHSKTVDINSI